MDLTWFLIGLTSYFIWRLLYPSKPKSTVNTKMEELRLSGISKEDAERKLNQLIDRMPEPERTYYKRDLFLEKNLRPFYWIEWLFWQVHPKAKWKFITNIAVSMMIFSLVGGSSMGTLGVVLFLIGWIIFDIMSYRYQLMKQATIWNKEFCDKFLDN